MRANGTRGMPNTETTITIRPGKKPMTIRAPIQQARHMSAVRARAETSTLDGKNTAGSIISITPVTSVERSIIRPRPTSPPIIHGLALPPMPSE